jgi:hypothetical protein
MSKKRYIRCKILTLRELRLQKIRAALNVVVPKLIREVIESGKNTQEWFVKELEENIKNENAIQGLLDAVSRLWIDDKTDDCNVQSVLVIAQTLAYCSFAPGGTTAALGTKFLGLEFDATKPSGGLNE